MVVCTYPYLLDPKIAWLVRGTTPRESVVVCDEAHLLDATCAEQMSLHLRVPTVNRCSSLLAQLAEQVEALGKGDDGGDALQKEYAALVAGACTLLC